MSLENLWNSQFVEGLVHDTQSNDAQFMHKLCINYTFLENLKDFTE